MYETCEREMPGSALWAVEFVDGASEAAARDRLAREIAIVHPEHVKVTASKLGDPRRYLFCLVRDPAVSGPMAA